MLLGILSDTHDELDRTLLAVQLLCEAGAEAIVHCGDLTGRPVLAACAARPCWFVFGNHDSDSVPHLRRAGAEFGAVCLEWGGVVERSKCRVDGCSSRILKRSCGTWSSPSGVASQ